MKGGKYFQKALKPKPKDIDSKFSMVIICSIAMI